jgi:hypothetical protein
VKDDQLNKWLNQNINELQPHEEKEYIFSSEYAGRRVNIKIKIDAINNTPKSSSTITE